MKNYSLSFYFCGTYSTAELFLLLTDEVWEKILHWQWWTGEESRHFMLLKPQKPNGLLRATESLLLSETQTVPHVTRDCFFSLWSSLKDTNRIYKSLGRAIIRYNNLKACLMYSSFISVANCIRAECIQGRAYCSSKWFESSSRKNILQGWICWVQSNTTELGPTCEPWAFF